MDDKTQGKYLYQALNAVDGLQKAGKPDEDGIQGYVVNEGWDLHQLFVMLDVLARAYRSAQAKVRQLEAQMAGKPMESPEELPEEIPKPEEIKLCRPPPMPPREVPKIIINNPPPLTGNPPEKKGVGKKKRRFGFF